MSGKQPGNFRARREQQNQAKRLEQRINKQRRHARELERRHEELLEEKRALVAKNEQIPFLERRISELEGGYVLRIEAEDGRKHFAIRRGYVTVWQGASAKNLKPRHSRKAHRVLRAFERSEK